MATIKSFSDLQQSKKLAAILPLESADMNWHELPNINLFARTFPYKHENGATEGVYPCWSLAALLNVLPRIDIEKEICSDDTFDYRVKAYIGDGYIGDWFDNPIDACYRLILKLHEQKLL